MARCHVLGQFTSERVETTVNSSKQISTVVRVVPEFISAMCDWEVIKVIVPLHIRNISMHYNLVQIRNSVSFPGHSVHLTK